MTKADPAWPDGLDPNVIALSFDVEWAHQDVIDGVCRLLDERGITGTFFVTHDGVRVPGHERGLHPNFRRNGDLYRSLPGAGTKTDGEVDAHIVATALSFAPEAKGVRTHGLHFTTELLGTFARHGLEYDSTLRLELAPGLRPVWKQSGILELPTYYCDFFDMDTNATGFKFSRLRLDAPGMKIFDFHPNLIAINAATVPEYDATRSFYKDPERLNAARHGGPGTRSLFVALLDEIVRRKLPHATLGELNSRWRTHAPSW